jgi:hypothetical protein
MVVLGRSMGSRFTLMPYGQSIPLRTLDRTVNFLQVDVMNQMSTTDWHLKKVRGLSNYDHVSFESYSRPGRFLRHFGPDSRVEMSNGLFDPWFGEHATFRPRWAPGVPSWAQAMEFEAVNYPGCFLRKVGDQLRLSAPNNTQPFTAFVERDPASLGYRTIGTGGGWTSTNRGPWYCDNWGRCTGLTPWLGKQKVTTVAVVLSTGRVVVSAAVSLPFVGLYPIIRLHGRGYYEPYYGAVYSIERLAMPCML